MAPLPASKNIKSCYNPKCKYFNTINEKAPLKCARCKLDCQKAHWPTHKEFCEIWAETAKNNGEVPVVQIKKKMTQFIWLVRGVLDYSAALYKEFLRWKRQGRQGCIEFYFENYNELYEALRVLEALPVVDHVSFYPMPFAPTYSEDANGKPAAQKLPVRVVTQEREEAFTREVDNRVNFTESTQEARPNMMNCLKLLGANENMFMISVTVKLHGTYSTHMFDFLYKRHSWYPEDGPWPEEKERSKKRK